MADVMRDPRVLLAACLLHPLPVALATAIKEVLATAALAQAESAQPAIPLENSREARQAIEEMLAEYDHPTNPNNAARAGWRAARLYTAPPQQAAEAVAEIGKGMK